MLSLNSLLIGSDDPKRLSEFYEKVFEKSPDMKDNQNGWYGFLVGKCFFSIGGHSKVKGKAKEPFRIIFNFETEKVKEEFERIKKTEGVVVVKEPYEMDNMWISTFSDPDGNYFQLVSPWKGKT